MSLGDVISQINLPDFISYHCSQVKGGKLHRERGGVICDPIPGREENKPSFSIYRAGGRWRFKRHGREDEGGDALDFLELLGYSKRQAIEEILSTGHLCPTAPSAGILKRSLPYGLAARRAVF